MIILEIVAVSLVGGFLALDRAAVCQLMLSRPIVAAPIIAIMLGEPVVGLKVGLILELLWIHCLPVGASIPPDETIVSVLVTAITVWSMSFFEGNADAIISLSLIIVIPAAILAQRMDSYIRKRNIRSAHMADRAIEDFDLNKLQRECLKGIKRFYLAYVAIFFIFLSIGTLFIYFLYPILPAFALRGLSVLYYVLPLVGIASVLTMARIKNTLSLFFASFVVFFGLIEVVKWW
ncbi:MAG: PTS sugar transporter subunit IIC [Proteobacteria bacterium]|nr:PTS sugar transporter subunit IIC [Pseudomonadota bacterium]